ncbi:ferritin [Geotalea uraniireducens]|uniref:Ferritin n=1 Tax=Geotalea uraniireducens TaxID=351604 RepID=A0ABM8EIR2_9BACT|nr:ferritin [Geotalea uraniireducens]BDV42362.1 ferritin [Geotalea uraniireducens]
MLSKKMSSALNKHLNIELYSAQLYLSMSSYANSIGLKGAANWFMVQYQEEMVHFMKFYMYLNSQGECVSLGPVEAPPNNFPSLLGMFEATLKHETFITSCINELSELAVKEKDHASRIFLQWFVTEQIEEEENDREIIGKLKLVGDNGYGLLLLDNELGTRVFTPPAAAAPGA